MPKIIGHRIQAPQPTMPFGRYKHQPLTEVPFDYLIWLLGLYDRGELAEWLRNEIHAELDERERVLCRELELERQHDLEAEWS
jgi:uncharacterized protein (DUF3820 family)